MLQITSTAQSATERGLGVRYDGEVDQERGSFSRRGLDVDAPAVPLDDVVYGREAKTRVVPVLFRREERLKGTGCRLPGHPATCVTDGQQAKVPPVLVLPSLACLQSIALAWLRQVHLFWAE